MVKRYDIEDTSNTDDPYVEVVERPHGDYVEYADYEELSDEVERLRAIIAECADKMAAA